MIRNIVVTQTKLHYCVVTELIERYGDGVSFHVYFSTNVLPYTLIGITECCNSRSYFVNNVLVEANLHGSTV
ncbi:hypothetical protein D3C84_1218620 [compost metagenome]